MKNQENYDAIVIGSGMGGLTTAALLAKLKGKKVLVLEKHWTIGGLTHEFERKRKYSWDVGVHYMGSIRPGDLVSDTFEYISDGNLEWETIDNPYDHFLYPDFKIEAYSDPKKYKKSLCDKFPAEKEAILQYFKDVKKVSGWTARYFVKQIVPNPLSWGLHTFNNFFGGKLALQTTKEYLDTHFKDPKLKGVLASQWGDYGYIPEESSFVVHAMIVGAFIKGGAFPKGGSKSIAKHVVPTIEKAGGKCMINCEVEQIIVEKGKAKGVKCFIKKGRNSEHKSFYAPLIISNVGAYGTFRKLLEKPLFPELEKFQTGLSAVTVYLGLKGNPAEKLGVNNGNYWMFDGYDHDNLFKKNDPINGKPAACFLSFPSLKSGTTEHHTAEIITLINYDAFKEWERTEWQKRGESYEQLKEEVGNRLIEFVEKRFPGFSEMIDYVEVSTPLSMENFTGRHKGMMYGMPATPERYKLTCLGPKTPISGLYLSGSDVLSVGVGGALLGGLAAACAIEGPFGIRTIPKIQMEANKIRKNKPKTTKKEKTKQEA